MYNLMQCALLHLSRCGKRLETGSEDRSSVVCGWGWERVSTCPKVGAGIGREASNLMNNGKGDFLFRDSTGLRRGQCTYISDEDFEKSRVPVAAGGQF